MKKLVTAMVLLIGSSAPARAEEPQAVSQESKQAKPSEEGAALSPKEMPKNAAPDDKQAGKEPGAGTDTGEKTQANPPEGSGQQSFTDRDGDGIQDGKEHRFRGKHRRGLQKGILEENGTEEGQKRHRARHGGNGR